MSIVFARVEPRHKAGARVRRRTRPRLRVLLERAGRKRTHLGAVPLPPDKPESAWFFKLVDTRLAVAGIVAEERAVLAGKIRDRLARESRPKLRAKPDRLRALALRAIHRQDRHDDPSQ